MTHYLPMTFISSCVPQADNVSFYLVTNISQICNIRVQSGDTESKLKNKAIYTSVTVLTDVKYIFATDPRTPCSKLVGTTQVASDYYLLVVRR